MVISFLQQLERLIRLFLGCEKYKGMNLAKYIQSDENRRLNTIDISIKILFTI